ncbi:MAG TPA: RidA family protein [Ktedonobacterales bacterium]|jgi:enamine deaminase RidA (YjgF/YER057c/UK114 family)|nr:RidA family protein [Ktedonobacterales bacterium]
MEKRIVAPNALTRPRGFSHGVVTTGGRILWLAGQDASDAEGRIVAPGDLVAQLDQALHNLHAVVHEAGGQMTDIVKLSIFVADRDDYVAKQRELGIIWRRYFDDYYPALALFEVAGFYQSGALIEIEGFAALPEEQPTLTGQ